MMARLLLDTHVLLWWLGDDDRLGEQARLAIADPANEAVVSAVSGWEIAIKRDLGKLKAPADLEAHVKGQGFTLLSMTFGHAEQVASLPPLHRDPFDRMLVAQAKAEGLVLVTQDARIKGYDVSVLDA